MKPLDANGRKQAGTLEPDPFAVAKPFVAPLDEDQPIPMADQRTPGRPFHPGAAVEDDHDAPRAPRRARPPGAAPLPADEHVTGPDPGWRDTYDAGPWHNGGAVIPGAREPGQEERTGGAPLADQADEAAGPWTAEEEELAARVASIAGGELPDVLDQLDAGLDQLRGAYRARPPAKQPLPEVLRSIREAQARLVSGPAAEKELRRLVRETRAAEQLAPPPRVPPAYACAFQNAAAVRRVRTGFPTLDALCRGAGLELGRVHAVSGPPNIGKTAFVVQLGCAFARAECIVLFHVADVDRRADVATRIGAAHGIPLADLEARSPAALAEVEILLREKYPLLTIVDQRTDRMMVEDSIAMLLQLGRRNPGVPLVYIPDSIQKAKLRAMAAPGARTMLDKERADAVLDVLADAADAGMLVLPTSEVPRDFYSGRQGEGRSDMAAFKSSGSIEYALTTGIVLRSIPGEDNAVRAGVPKNKRAKEGALKLLFDPDRGTFLDGGQVDYDGGAPGARPKRTKDNGPELHAPPTVPHLAARARRLLEEEGPYPNKTAWRAAIGGKTDGRLEAMAYCKQKGWIRIGDGPDGTKGWLYYQAPISAAPVDAPRVCLVCGKPEDGPVARRCACAR